MLIGKSGENIKSIMDEFDVNVQVPGKILIFESVKEQKILN